MPLRTMLLSLLLCVSAQAADRKLLWDDDQTDVLYNVYERVAGKLLKLGSSTAKEFDLLDIQPGQHVYVVTASNHAAESIPTEVTLPAGVSNLRVVGTLFLEIK